jgi:hypothetical protein
MNMPNDAQSPNPDALQEPSVLDYIKSKLSFGRGVRIEIPEYHEDVIETRTELQPATLPGSSSVARPFVSVSLPWFALGALGLALFAQSFFEPPNTSAISGIAFYIVALGLLVWAVFRGEWVLTSPADSSSARDPLTFRRLAFIISIPFAALAFLFFTGNLFTVFNLTLWSIALGLFIWSLWLRDLQVGSPGQRLREFLGRKNWRISISRWTILLLAATVLVVFFRVYQLQQTPAEPFSDHAEKILDVYDVSQGQTHIFFPRNTGREAIQMYWTLLISWIFGTGLTFLSLKIGTILLGLFTLPYIYLLGKEIGNSRVGFIAFVFAGIGYWPNVISRIGLRFPLYPMFVAPLLFYLIRGLRAHNRNDFIIAGILLGLGLNGYTPFRIVPFLVLAAFILYFLHTQSRGVRQDALVWLVIVILTSFIVFLPLLRYAMENPDMFSYRALSRLNVGQSLPAPWYQIFLSNTWNALTMINWNDGVVWVNSLPDRPALDVVSGALFLIGVVLVLIRYFQKRHWLDLFLVLSIPILMLPSILALAFPSENPELNRTGGALVPIFLIVGLALDGLINILGGQPALEDDAEGLEKRQPIWTYAFIGILFFFSAAQNFDIVFHQFDQNYRDNAWNTSEMGAIIKQFGLTYGETDTVWIVPFPYWVDTRLPGVWAGIPNRDFAEWPAQLADTYQSTGPKLFIVKANLQDPSQNDQTSLDMLHQLYPQGWLSLHESPIPNHDFWIYLIPGPTTP